MAGTPSEVEATSFSSVDVREAAYARIREEIASSEAITRFWKRRHNELSLISRLPPEILVIIFKHTAETHLHKRVRWIFVSHVCSQWRSVALNASDLWSDIPFHYPTWAWEMLARSKAAPLTITVTLGEAYGTLSLRNVPALGAALMQLSRVRVLSLHDDTEEETFMELISLLDSPAPLLETVDISFARPMTTNELPENLFSGEAPRLAHLTISSCSLNWRAPIFGNLRSLTVTFTLAVNRPPADQFIAALSNMLSLENLEFESDFGTDVSVPVPHEMVASLPRLAKLAVRSQLPSCVLLLDHITYPNAAHVSVTCNTAVYNEDYSTGVSLVERVVEILGRRVDGPIRSLALSQHGIKAWTSPGIDVTSPSTAAPQLDVKFLYPSGLEIFVAEVTTDALRPLSLQDVESFAVHGVHLPKTVWLDRFGNITGLKNLYVNSSGAGFFHAYSSGTLSTPEPSDGLKFRALHKLTVHEWFFDERRPDTLEKTSMEMLKDCLKARRKGGLILFELVLDRCRVSKRDVAELEEIVEEVTWDRELNVSSEREMSDDYYWNDVPPWDS